MTIKSSGSEYKLLSKVFYTFVIFIMSLGACKKGGNGSGNENPKHGTLSFEQTSWKVDEGSKIELKIRVKGNDGSSYYNWDQNSLALTWSTSDNDVLSISQKGEVTGKKPGVTAVMVKSADDKYSISTEVIVFNSILTNKISKPLSNDLIYSKGVYLVRNSVIQCFDVDSKGTIYYDQLGGGLAHIIFVIKGEPNQSHSSSMQLKYFGHGTNMAIEEVGDDRYVWIGSNGHKGSDGSYGSNKTFSRIKYVANGIVENYAPDDTYYFPGKANIHPAIDQENDLLAVTTSGGGDTPLRYFYVYKLSQVKALVPTRMSLPSLKYGGEEVGVPEQTVVQNIDVKDLSKVTPIAKFSVPPTKDKTKVDFYAFQGFDISEGKLYFYEGEGNANTLASGASNAFITIFDYASGKEVSKRTRVAAIADLAALNSHGITATGYMEAEGIKMKNGILYLGFASKSTDDQRRANIFIYKK